MSKNILVIITLLYKLTAYIYTRKNKLSAIF